MELITCDSLVAIEPTTLFPTFVFLAIMLLLWFGKPVAQGGRIISMYLLKTHEDHEREKLPVGTMCGAYIAIFTSIIWLINYLTTGPVA